MVSKLAQEFYNENTWHANIILPIMIQIFMLLASYFCFYSSKMLLFCKPNYTQPGGRIIGSNIDLQIYEYFYVPVSMA